MLEFYGCDIREQQGASWGHRFPGPHVGVSARTRGDERMAASAAAAKQRSIRATVVVKRVVSIKDAEI